MSNATSLQAVTNFGRTTQLRRCQEHMLGYPEQKACFRYCVRRITTTHYMQCRSPS